ncbi:hypothetical protein BGZ94_000207, partial [Podila epigama]
MGGMIGQSPILTLKAALWLATATIFIQHATASVISASKASTTDFELQTNLISCGTENVAANADSSTNPAVCTKPESKLFSHIKVLNGTPHPGPTGVRGRLYDVGTLCTDKVAEKIDRAWIAFLDCSGCPLSTKMANLHASNPQAVLIYNQAACIYPAPATVPPAPASPPPAPAPASPPPAASPAAPPAATPAVPSSNAPVVVTTTQAAAPGATPSEPSKGDNSGDKGGEGEGESEDDEDHVKHPIAKRALRHFPRDQLVKHIAMISALEKRGGDTNASHQKGKDNQQHQQAIAPTNTAEPYYESGTTIALAEQVTIDYLFQILQGPASNAPLPGALKSIKVHHSAVRTLGEDEEEDGGADSGES